MGQLDEKTQMENSCPTLVARAQRPLGPRHFWDAEDRLPIIGRQTSADGTTKLILGLSDGHAIESVAMVMPKTRTLCLSTQIGCPVGCVFCSTGQSGYVRNLTAPELIAQARATARVVHADANIWPERIVFMGMGEPLLNLDNLLRALDLLTSPQGPDLSWRKIVVSTVGIPKALQKLAAARLAMPAISLHAPTQELRDRLMPGARTWPLTELLPILEEYPLPGRERILIEYILIHGVNDALDQAARLHDLLRGARTKINIIPCNPSPASPFRRPPTAVIERFAERLRALGRTVFIRRSLGAEVLAACGQLRQARSSVRDHHPEHNQKDTP